MSRKALLLACAALYAAALLAGCAETPGPGLARGKMMFDNCTPCHGADGYGNPALGAPAIAGLPRWYVERQLIDLCCVDNATYGGSLGIDGDHVRRYFDFGGRAGYGELDG